MMWTDAVIRVLCFHTPSVLRTIHWDLADSSGFQDKHWADTMMYTQLYTSTYNIFSIVYCSERELCWHEVTFEEPGFLCNGTKTAQLSPGRYRLPQTKVLLILIMEIMSQEGETSVQKKINRLYWYLSTKKYHHGRCAWGSISGRTSFWGDAYTVCKWTRNLRTKIQKYVPRKRSRKTNDAFQKQLTTGFIKQFSKIWLKGSGQQSR